MNPDALAEKYRILIELRARREELETLGLDGFPPEEAAVRRRQFRALARRFPSCLVELELPLAELRRRHEVAMRGLQETASPSERAWLRSMADRHLLLRLALSARRLERRGGGGERFLDRCRRLEARAAAQGRRGPGIEAIARALGVEVGDLFDSICHPPGGRLRPLVDRVVGETTTD